MDSEDSYACMSVPKRCANNGHSLNPSLKSLRASLGKPFDLEEQCRKIKDFRKTKSQNCLLQ